MAVAPILPTHLQDVVDHHTAAIAEIRAQREAEFARLPDDAQRLMRKTFDVQLMNETEDLRRTIAAALSQASVRWTAPFQP